MEPGQPWQVLPAVLGHLTGWAMPAPGRPFGRDLRWPRAYLGSAPPETGKPAS
jgi:hypothetical protein